MGRGNIMSSCTRRYCDPLVTQATRRPPEEHSRFWLIRNDVAGREEGESRGGSSFESAQDHNARADMNAHSTDRLVPSLAFKYHFRHNYLARPFIHLTHLHWLILQSPWMARMREGWLTDWLMSLMMDRERGVYDLGWLRKEDWHRDWVSSLVPRNNVPPSSFTWVTYFRPKILYNSTPQQLTRQKVTEESVDWEDSSRDFQYIKEATYLSNRVEMKV